MIEHSVIYECLVTPNISQTVIISNISRIVVMSNINFKWSNVPLLRHTVLKQPVFGSTCRLRLFYGYATEGLGDETDGSVALMVVHHGHHQHHCCESRAGLVCRDCV